MNNRRSVGFFLSPYKKRRRLITLFDIIVVLSFISVIPALLSGLTGFRIAHIPVYIAAAVLSSLIVVLKQDRDDVLWLDNLTECGGALITYADLCEKEPDNPYLPLMEERLDLVFSAKPPQLCLPSDYVRKAAKAFAGIILVLLALFIPGIKASGENDPAVIMRDAASELSRAADKEPELTRLTDKLSSLAREHEEQKPLDEEEKESIGEIAEELKSRIKDLERNSLSELFENNADEFADRYDSLASGEMDLPESREFILDLLSNVERGSPGEQKMMDAFKDFSEKTKDRKKPEPEDQNKLAERLLEAADPEAAELKDSIGRAVEALEKLKDSESAAAPGNFQGTSGEKAAGEAASDAVKNGEKAEAAGNMPASETAGPSPFVPYEGESPRVKLPEGVNIAKGDRGIIRLEGEEKFSLERIQTGAASGEEELSLLEEATRAEGLPDDYNEIIKNYFISIGYDAGE